MTQNSPQKFSPFNQHYRRLITMNVEQMKKQLAIMKVMLEDMQQEREEAGAKYSDSSEFIRQLDEDISLAATTIRGCERVIKESK